MTQSLTRSMTAALVALVAACALLLGSSFTASADAAVSHATQLSKARGHASFFCFAWQCRSFARTSYSWRGTKLTTRWRISRPRNVMYHGDCTIYADMVIYVNSSGGTSAGMVRCD